MARYAAVVLLVLALVAGSASANRALKGDPAAKAKTTTITSSLAGAPAAQFSTLLAAVKAAGLADALNKPDLALTIFAPTNAAFAKLITALKTTPEKLLADKALLTKVLSYHVVPVGAAKSTSLKNGQKWATLLKGQDLTVDLSKAGTVVIKGATNSATVVAADVPAGKSIVHVIDTVLVPK
ncbi:fasciclin-like protein [Monoraphidium neglectum]|uniref:Fasciclin-like protein n=1 Tax=Monoraphidium neglectum TaxID=145388 RepID=A0A0D2NNM3_9CHLO|nr:fasciclin-like protein [Monoraphidium neglectum]KIZ06076.1 fasciclin-like protein [Monoraphidium neglectum]|eukprot:XP_013905095.1 fasciclin-like protein [Monoraphidium neglectum]